MKIYRIVNGENTILVSHKYIADYISRNSRGSLHFMDHYNQLTIEVKDGELERCNEGDLLKNLVESLLQFKLGKKEPEHLYLYCCSVELRRTENFLIAAPNERVAKEIFKHYCPFEPNKFELLA